MCGYLATTEKAFVVSNVVAPFIGPNPRRHSLTIFVPSGNRVTISQRSDVALGAGITISNSNSPYTLSYEAFGDWIRRQLFAIGDVAAVNGGYVESTDIDMPVPTLPGDNFQKQGVRYGYPPRVGSTT